MLQHLPTKSLKKNGNPKQNPDAIINGGGGGLVGWSVSRMVFSERALLSHPNFQQNNYFIRQLCQSDKRLVFARHLVAISPNKSGATHPVLQSGMRNICPSAQTRAAYRERTSPLASYLTTNIYVGSRRRKRVRSGFANWA